VKRLLVVAGIFSLILLLLPFILLEIYRGTFPTLTPIETWRISVDKQLEALYYKRTPLALFVDQTVFHTLDNNFWEPPRVMPVYDKQQKKTGYKVYGMVRFWDANAKLLGLNSYLGKPMFVRFDPDSQKTLAIFLKMDGYGELSEENSEFLFVDHTDIPQWSTLFCVGDVVSVEAKTANVFDRATRTQPLIPTLIVLARRLCKK
jgi:hypothetical protein